MQITLFLNFWYVFFLIYSLTRDFECVLNAEKNEASSIVYKVGECLQELLKSWKEFKKTQESTEDSLENGPILEIRIPAEHVIATNRQVM